jgi:Xaa-Pro aminopeptidase
MEKTIFERRIRMLRDYLCEKHTDATVLTSFENRFYFCGFTGSNGYLIVTQSGEKLVTDKRYTTQAAQQAPDCEIIEQQKNSITEVTDVIRAMKIESLVLEASLSAGEYFAFREQLGEIPILLEEERYLEMRMIKEPGEIDAIRRAIKIAETAFVRLIPTLKIGTTEKELACELEYLCKREGADQMSFETICASGPRGALAHGFPTDKKIEDGEMTVVDFGVFKDGYCSDMTRTLLFGTVPPERMRIFRLVREAVRLGVGAVCPGAVSGDVEEAHRAPYYREGLNDYELKGLGHGIGVEIHECPRIVIANPTVLKPNMVFTIEPGLYFPGDCGVRLEDNVLVTQDGVEDLSHTPYEIHIG